MAPWYIATEKFSPDTNPQGWAKYLAWSGLKQLNEVVSLDGMLCPTVLPEIKDSYWPYIVNEDFMLNFFTDYAFLAGEVAAVHEKNVLCVFRNPSHQPKPSVAANFEFVGYDLVDTRGLVSALTNCGGFPDAFSNQELSCKGLLESHQRAVEVQRLLRERYSSEHHASCHVWAIYRAGGL